jgi:PKD repeat protein
MLLILATCIVLSPVGAAVVTSGNLPISFIENKGQADGSVRFLAESPGMLIYFTPNGEVFYAPSAGKVSAVTVTYRGANPAPEVTGMDELTGKANFFIGNNREAWVTNVPTFRGITYDDLYEGISLRYTGVSGILEREFVIRPGADPAAIIMQYAGQDRITFNDVGGLVVSTPVGDLIEGAPVCYQIMDGERVAVDCSYMIGESGTVRFAVGAYQKNQPLIIDPVIDFSTYFGGSSDDIGMGIGLDDIGNVYFVGSTLSTDLPLPNAAVFQEHLNGTWDIFVAKFSPDGQTLIYSTYIGGNSTDMGAGIAVDNSTGDVFITGYSFSADYPVTRAPAKNNLSDVVVTALGPTGSTLDWSRYFAGNKTDEATGITLDYSGGHVAVVGFTNSDNFTATVFANSLSGSFDAFIATFDVTNGDNPVSPRYIGGTGGDYAYGVAADSAGDFWITGSTNSMFFPTTMGAFRKTPQGKIDAFITKVPANLGTPLHSTYLGASGDDYGRGIALDSNDYPYVTGYTDSGVAAISLFPIKPYFSAFQTTYGGGKYDAFVTKMEKDLSALNYSTYLGGNYEDRGYAIAVDDLGEAHITGFTISTNFPVTPNAFQSNRDGLVQDVIFTELNATGQALVFSTYLGGTYYDEGRGIAISGDGLNITLTGFTESLNYDIYRAYQPYLAGFSTVRRQDAFVTKIMKIPPVANFTGTPLKGCSPLIVNFTDTSTNTPTSWLWDFGDGNTSTEQNPQHTFYNPDPNNPVNFTVNLTACNADGCGFVSKFNYTMVCPHLFWDFTSNQSRGCVGTNATIMFNGTPGAPINLSTWYFDFGDGTVGTPGVTYIHTYTAPGMYNVSFWVENECCNNTTLKLEFVDIRATPVADFFAIPTFGLSPLAVDFFDNSTGVPSSWDWFFGAGEGNSTLQNPDHVYTTKGHYSVTLTACNFCGCDSETKTDYIRIDDPNLTFLPIDLVVPTNDTTPLDLYLERADAGLSGFDLNLFWADTVHGNITGVVFPSWAVNQTVIGTLPGPSIQVRGFDPFNYVTPGATNVYLGTFNLTGITPTYPSTMWFNVSVNELDDNFGDPVYTNSIPANITVVRLLPFPGKINPPTDPDGDQLYWDVNGNGLIDFSDVVTYFQNMQWIRDNQYVPFFDYNGNGLIDFADLILLFHKV